MSNDAWKVWQVVHRKFQVSTTQELNCKTDERMDDDGDGKEDSMIMMCNTNGDSENTTNTKYSKYK